jgi:hypothetical protein
VPEVIEAVLDTYRRERVSAGDHLETFIDTLRRIGLEPFKAAERPEVPALCELAADATELLVQVGLEPAQNQVHAW